MIMKECFALEHLQYNYCLCIYTLFLFYKVLFMLGQLMNYDNFARRSRLAVLASPCVQSIVTPKEILKN